MVWISVSAKCRPGTCGRILGLWVVLSSAVWAAGCAGSESGHGGPDAAMYDGSGRDGRPDGVDGRVPDGSMPRPDGQAPGPDAAAMSSCYHVCNSPSDCALGNTLYDADNYQCSSNRCRWLGCNNTTECVDTMMDTRYVCGTLPSTTLPMCYRSCNASADCSLGNALHDADNYHCTSNLCEWLGCNNTAECVDTFMSNDYACGTVPPLAVPSCYHVCNTPADCTIANALYDADNYQCSSNLCRWIGCNDTAECVAGMNDNGYVCE